MKTDNQSRDIGDLLAAADPAENITELELLRSRRRSLSLVLPSAEQAPHGRAEGDSKPIIRTTDTCTVATPLGLHPATVKKTRTRRVSRRALLVSAAAALLVGGLVTAEVVMPAYSGATAEAAEVLNDAAAATIKTSDPVVVPGQYLKIETTAVSMGAETNENGETHAWLGEHRDQLYVPSDRSGEWIWHRGPGVATTFFTEAARAVEAAQDKNPQPEHLRATEGAFYGTPQTIIHGMETKEAIRTLPRDPHQLLTLIYLRTLGAGPTPEIEALVTIADTLRTGVIPADLRAALYKAAALIPGVTIVDRQANLDGRTGIAIGIPGEISRQEIIIDPATGLLIGERTVLLKTTPDIPAFPAGTATAWTAIKTSVVDSAP